MQRNVMNAIVRGLSRVTIEKPPKSLYTLYLRENYLKLKSETESNNLPFNKKTMTDMIRDQYKNITLEEKEELKEKLRVVKEEYIKMKNMDVETKEYEIMKFADSHGMPKGAPKSTFNIYLQEMLPKKEIYPELSARDKFKQVIHDFKNMSDSESQVYHEKYATIKADHETLLKEWVKAKNVPLFNNRKKIAYYFYYKEKYSK